MEINISPLEKDNHKPLFLSIENFLLICLLKKISRFQCFLEPLSSNNLSTLPFLTDTKTGTDFSKHNPFSKDHNNWAKIVSRIIFSGLRSQIVPLSFIYFFVSLNRNSLLWKIWSKHFSFIFFHENIFFCLARRF